MPLTNPNKVVTEERLSEFYGQILPYMGGMPDVLANKFSKSDIYSTDEKMIGVWTDNKPLYQKIIIISSSDIPNSNIKYINHNISNLDTVVYVGGMIQGTSTNSTPLPRVQDNNASNCMGVDVSKTQVLLKGRGTNYTGTFNSGFVILKYTKTTDSPISIGSDTDYSTTEKIVGTWIDGSPVWQNTVSTGGSVPTGATLILRTAMASTGYDTILYTKTS